jgi:hypothetical protein
MSYIITDTTTGTCKADFKYNFDNSNHMILLSGFLFRD